MSKKTVGDVLDIALTRAERRGCEPATLKNTHRPVTLPVLSPKRADLFWSKVERPVDGCWEWQGKTTPCGYGYFSVGDQNRRAHRIAYTLVVGPIPDGLSVLHHCDNRVCVRPDHLFIGTLGDNNRDRAAKGRSSRLARGPTTLTPEAVRFIRANYRCGSHTWGTAALGRRFGVCHEAVRKVLNGETWAWVPQEEIA